MLRIGAKAKLIAGAPGIELVIGRSGGALRSYEIPLDTLDLLITALQRDRDDAIEFFRRVGVLPPAPESKSPRRRPALRLIAPAPESRSEDPTREMSVDAIPTPMLPPPMEKER
jgi:hypothetical protein